MSEIVPIAIEKSFLISSLPVCEFYLNRPGSLDTI